MAADLQALVRNYRLRARIAGGTDLNRQREILVDRFLAEDEAGPVEATAISGTEGASTSWQFRGSTPEERMTALQMAIAELDAEIAAAAAGEAAPGRIGAVIPRVACAPL